MRTHTAAIVALSGAIALAALPLVLPSYYVGLMIPFYGYAIALLGFNLLFGYTGLLSFGHAIFLGLGAYGAAVMSGMLAVKSFEIVLIGVMAAAAVVALPIGFLCVRYVGIFFGMLTLAFGMLVHSFLFKFYYVTGGDSGMRVPRMSILGLEFDQYNKIDFLAGPFYYYCLALLIVAGLVMWRIVHSPFGLHLKAIRDNPRKAEYLASASIASGSRRSSSPRYSAPPVGRSSASGSGSPIRNWSIGRSPANSSSWRFWEASRTSSDRSSARSPSPGSRTSCNR